jgi:DNA (cytosine-5)-methyltransferase 1
MGKLTCIDTFSGIGGLTLGLHDFATTIQYCEWDPYCKQVLLDRMEEGRIDRAPIHDDIKNLHVAPVVQPQMICGGFPCQDISSMGKQKGIIEGERSSMFYHIMRIVDECPSINVVFLENVPNILNCGIQEVIDECVKRGFNLQWTVMSAGGMGAPHIRNRWFCLACKPGTDLSMLDLAQGTKSDTFWEAEPVPRVVLKCHQHHEWIARCQALGNAVVPFVAREAFAELATTMGRWEQLSVCLQTFAMDLSTIKYPFPESGLIFNGVFYPLPKRPALGRRHGVEICICKDDIDMTMDNFPTPRRGITHASSLTDRSLHDLPTVLVYSSRKYLEDQGIDTCDKLHTKVSANVQYIEWMMGYEPDWTLAKVQRKVVLQSKESNPDNQRSVSPTTVGDKKKFRLNGVHMLLKEYPGKDISFVAQKWRELSVEEQERYKKAARDIIV